MPVALVDADSILYKVGFTFEEKTDWGDGDGVSITSDLQTCKNAIDGLIENIRFKTGCEEVELWLTGSNNFRHDVVDDYKHNRVLSRKPTDYDRLKLYLLHKYDANVADGFEADDMVVYLKTAKPDDYFLCAIDKDVLYQTVGSHFNYNEGNIVKVTEKEAIRFFYFQVLAGDTTDGYKGVPSIGKVKANKLLDKVEEDMEEGYSLEDLEKAYWEAVKKIANSVMEGSEEEVESYLLTQARLASMHQLKCDENGDFFIDLWKPLV